MKNGKRCIRIHAFLTDDDHVEHRKNMLTTIGHPGEFSKPTVEVPDRRGNTSHLEFVVVACIYNHPINKCRCHLPIYSAGQDEKIFHSDAIPRRDWKFKHFIRLLKKSAGVGIIVSGIVDSYRGFSFPMSQEELTVANSARLMLGKSPLQSTRMYLFLIR